MDQTAIREKVKALEGVLKYMDEFNGKSNKWKLLRTEVEAELKYLQSIKPETHYATYNEVKSCPKCGAGNVYNQPPDPETVITCGHCYVKFRVETLK